MKVFEKISKALLAGAFAVLPFMASAATPIAVDTPFTAAENEVFSFTPASNGNLTIYIKGEWPNYNLFPGGTSALLYSDEACTDTDKITCSTYNGSETGNIYSNYLYFGLKEGEVYYFRQSIYNSVEVTFKFEAGEATGAVLADVIPSTDGGPLDYINTPEIKVYASGGVTGFGKITLSYGSKSVVLSDNPATYGVYTNGPEALEWLQIGGGSFPDFKNLLSQVANSGEGFFTITIADLKAGGLPVTSSEVDQEGVTINDDGVITITYEIAVAPQYLPQSSTWPATIYQYWDPGENGGMAVLQFSEAIKSVDNVNLVMIASQANSQPGNVNFNTYNIPFEINPQNPTQVLLDFTGQWLNGTSTKVTVIVYNVVAFSGLTVDFSSDPLSSVGALYKQIPYVGEIAPGSSKVTTIESSEELGAAYNLQGVKVDTEKLPKGIYIVNGKKVVVK